MRRMWGVPIRWQQGVIAAAMALLPMTPADAADYYVATDGNDSHIGSLESPFASLSRAQQTAAPGDTVWIRGGTYRFTAGQGASANAVLFNKSGRDGAPIRYWAYANETPAFDFTNYRPIERIRGFSVQADHLHFRGLELRGVQQTIPDVNESWAIRVERGGDHNIFERLNLHHNQGPGLFIADGGYNLVLNSDSHHNYDPARGGENADGFGSHSNDPGNTFIGNRAWENSDDGYDLIRSGETVIVKNNWAWRNGYEPGTDRAAGNGAGFKMGGYGLDPSRFPEPGDVPRHLVEGNVAFQNRVQGFYANHHPGGLDFLNNTAFDNARGFDLLADVEADTYPADHLLRNNLAFANHADVRNLTESTVDDLFNSWNLAAAVTAQDFMSLDPAGVDGARREDGSLPLLDFLRLAPDSVLVDAGIELGRPYSGAAPDLGAFEVIVPEAGSAVICLPVILVSLLKRWH